MITIESFLQSINNNKYDDSLTKLELKAIVKEFGFIPLTMCAAMVKAGKAIRRKRNGRVARKCS